MGHDDAQSDDVEFLDVGPKRGSGDTGEPVRRWPRWLPVLLVAVLAAIVITMVTRNSSKPSASPATHPPTRGRSASSARPTTPATCTPRQTESRLRAFVEDFNAGKDDATSYFAWPGQFERWWDPTLPLGGDLHGRTGYTQLEPQLRSLHDAGIRLAFASFSGWPNDSNSIGFVLGERHVSRTHSPPEPMVGHGDLDCASGRFTTLVVDSWGSRS